MSFRVVITKSICFCAIITKFISGCGVGRWSVKLFGKLFHGLNIKIAIVGSKSCWIKPALKQFRAPSMHLKVLLILNQMHSEIFNLVSPTRTLFFLLSNSTSGEMVGVKEKWSTFQRWWRNFRIQQQNPKSWSYLLAGRTVYTISIKLKTS